MNTDQFRSHEAMNRSFNTEDAVRTEGGDEEDHCQNVYPG